MASRLKVFLIGFLGAAVLWLLRLTMRIERIGFDGEEAYWPELPPRIIAFWHRQQLMMPWLYRDTKRTGAHRRKIKALISQSKDGRFIAKAVSLLGISSIAGSSSKGGREALFGLIRTLRSDHVAVTPDGPRGPIFKVKDGIVRVAQLSRAPVYPVAIAFNHAWHFKSWDRMILPKPFSKAVLVMGKPLTLEREASDEEVAAFRQSIEDALNALSETATRKMSAP